jgi:hypothetical protein
LDLIDLIMSLDLTTTTVLDTALACHLPLFGSFNTLLNTLVFYPSGLGYDDHYTMRLHILGNGIFLSAQLHHHTSFPPSNDF